MGYRKVGFVVRPLSTYLLDYSDDIYNAFSENFDRDIAEVLKTLGKDTERLTNLWWERLLSVKSDRLDGEELLKQKFLIVLSHFTREIGFTDVEPVIVDYTVDPVLTIDEVCYRMLASRVQKHTADQLGGQYATFATLAYYFPEVIRNYMIILRELPLIIGRFRRWIGTLGYKLITGQPLSQHERTAFVLYSSTKPGTPGYSAIVDANGPINAAESSDLLVSEVAALYMANSLAGPSLQHQKLISDQLLRRLTYYFGPHSTDLKREVGFYQKYGPFLKLQGLTPTDVVAWTEDDHLAGLNARTNYISGSSSDKNPFAIRTPNGLINMGRFGAIGLYPDDPMFNLQLTDEKDVSNFEFDWASKWRGERINSVVHGGTMELALADMALDAKIAGACQSEHTTLDKIGLASFTEDATARITFRDDKHIIESYFLPSKGGPKMFDVTMTPFYARIGNVDVRPAFAEFFEVPLRWFMQPAPRVVEYVASRAGLAADERIRFQDVISLYHNCAVYTELTGNQPPIQPEIVARALLNI